MLDVQRGCWDGPRESRRFDPCNGFRAEAEAFAAMVRGDPAAWNGIGKAESVAVMQILDAIIASARNGGTAGGAVNKPALAMCRAPT